MKELRRFVFENFMVAYTLNQEASIVNIETVAVPVARAVC